MDERKNIRIGIGFPQKVDKEKWKLFTMEKDRESERVEPVDVEENKVFQNLSTSYQQIVDNVGKDIHDTHRGVYPHFFPGFPQKIP